MKKTVIVITGPTASGKSDIGIEVAKKINGVIISADSMQIYRNLNIGTAKVTEQEQKEIKHELIDIVGIDEKFSVSDYKTKCYEKIEEIFINGSVPIIVGGTGLYINAVVNNMHFSEEKEQDELNDKIAELNSTKNIEELLSILKELDDLVDEETYEGNRRRILRAIKLNMLGNKKSSIDNKGDLWNKNDSEYNFLVFYIDMPRDILYNRINNRIDRMINLGIIDESKMVYDAAKKNKNMTAAQAIGYKEFFEYIEGIKTKEECVEILKQKTRNYAKRQITWFKKLEPKITLDGTKSKEEITDNILKEYYEENISKR